MIEKINNNILNQDIIENCTWFTVINHPIKYEKWLVLMLLKGKNDKVYLLVADADSPEVTITDICNSSFLCSPLKNVDLHVQAIKDDNGIIFTLFDLTYTPPKKMTKEEIEKELGYEIDIME